MQHHDSKLLPQEAQQDDDDVSLIDIAITLGSRIRLLCAAPLAVGALTVGASFLMKPIYTAEAQIMPPQQQSTAAALLGSLGGGLASLGGSLAGLKNPSDQWIALLKSRTIADALIDQYKLMDLYESEYRFLARESLDRSTRITSGKDGLISIEFDDIDPKRAAAVVNSYIAELRELTKTLAVGEAAQRRVFFEKQLSDAKDNLTKAEEALRASGINTSVLKTSPESAVAGLAQLKAQVTAQEVTVSVMRQSMTDNSIELQRALTELSSLRTQLARFDKTDTAAANAQGSSYVEKYRNFKYYETLFELMARQFELAKADEARDGALIQVVDAAEVPEYKSKPKRGMMGVIATVGTFFLTALYILFQNGLQRFGATPEGALKLATLRRALPWGRRRSPV